MIETIARIPLPANAAVTELLSPGFDTSYPNIVDAERLRSLPEGARHFLDHCWLHGRFDAKPLRLIRLSDVYLAGEGLVFDRDLNVFDVSVTQQTPGQIEDARRELAAAVETQTLVAREGTSVLCVKPGQSNYGHWLVEMLPKAHLAQQHVAPGARMLVPDVQGPMRIVIRRSLELLAVREEQIAHALAMPEWCEELVLVHGLTEHGIYMSPLVFGSLDAIAAAVPERGGPDRLYVRRTEPANRLLAEEDAVASRLEGRGYAPIAPERLTLDGQIAAFRGARKIAGVASAALTNTAFCRPGAEVTIFYPESMPDTFYWFIAQHRGLSFTDIRCEQIDRSPAQIYWNDRIRLSPKVFAWYMR